MNTNPLASSGSARHKSAAFTLIELLVVISIIAVLAGILLPVTGAVMENARKTSAKSTEVNIVNAVKNFQTEYGVYPILATTSAGKDTTVGGNLPGGNAELFNVLRAIDTAAGSPNTRRIPFFEGKDVRSSGKPKDGFVPTGATLTGNNNAPLHVGDLVDPWGNVFFIRYDSGASDQIAHPYKGTPGQNDDDGAQTYDPTSMMRTGAVAWSYGKDGKQGNNGVVTGAPPNISSYGDDVVSWQ